MMVRHLFFKKIANRVKQVRSLMHCFLFRWQMRETNLILLNFFTQQSFMPLSRRPYIFLLESFPQSIDSLILDLRSRV